MNRKLLSVVAAGAVAMPGGSVHAAIDDAGMSYVSGGEGLGGSIRIRLLDRAKTDFVPSGIPDRSGDQWETRYDESRLYLVGDADLGDGWAATYYFEVRPEDGREGGRDSQLGMESVDVGLRGPVGWFRAGTVETASSAIMPSADLTNDIGTTGEKLADYYNSGIRWTSQDIRGLRLGASMRISDHVAERDRAGAGDEFIGLGGRLNALREEDQDGSHFDDSTVDQWDVAAVYSLPIGVSLGASYAWLNEVDDRDRDSKGVRVGAAYARDTWGFSYNFHRYKAYNAMEIGEQNARLSDDLNRWHYKEYNSSDNAIAEGEVLPNGIRSSLGAQPDAALSGRETVRLRGHPDTMYTEHVLGANVHVGKIGIAVNYSMAKHWKTARLTQVRTQGCSSWHTRSRASAPIWDTSWGPSQRSSWPTRPTSMTVRCWTRNHTICSTEWISSCGRFSAGECRPWLGQGFFRPLPAILPASSGRRRGGLLGRPPAATSLPAGRHPAGKGASVWAPGRGGKPLPCRRRAKC